MRNAEFWNYFSREKRGIPVYPFLRKNGADTSKTRRGKGAYKIVRDRATMLSLKFRLPHPLVKTAQIRARRGEEAHKIVRDRATTLSLKFRLPHPLVKTAQIRARQGVARERTK